MRINLLNILSIETFGTLWSINITTPNTKADTKWMRLRLEVNKCKIVFVEFSTGVFNEQGWSDNVKRYPILDRPIKR